MESSGDDKQIIVTSERGRVRPITIPFEAKWMFLPCLSIDHSPDRSAINIYVLHPPWVRLANVGAPGIGHCSTWFLVRTRLSRVAALPVCKVLCQHSKGVHVCVGTRTCGYVVKFHNRVAFAALQALFCVLYEY